MNKQQMRFTDGELSLVNKTFAENLEALIAVRKVFLGKELTEKQDLLFKEFVSSKPEVIKVLRKAFLPEVEGDEPLHQIIDLYMTIKIEEMDIEKANLMIDARTVLIDYLKRVFNRIEGGEESPKITDLMDFSKTPEERYVNLVARNTIIGHIELMLNQMQVLAGNKGESPEELKERLQKDSSK